MKSNVVSISKKRIEKFKPISDGFDLIGLAVADNRLSKDDIQYLIDFVSHTVKINRPFNEYIGYKEKKLTIKKLIDCGYLENTEPFDWIVDEAFLGFSVGDSLGIFQEIIINWSLVK